MADTTQASPTPTVLPSTCWECGTICGSLLTVEDGRVTKIAPNPAHPLPKFSPPRRVPHGVTLIGRLFDEGTLGRAGVALEREFGVSAERPPGF